MKRTRRAAFWACVFAPLKWGGWVGKTEAKRSKKMAACRTALMAGSGVSRLQAATKRRRAAGVCEERAPPTPPPVAACRCFASFRRVEERAAETAKQRPAIFTRRHAVIQPPILGVISRRHDENYRRFGVISRRHDENTRPKGVKKPTEGSKTPGKRVRIISIHYVKYPLWAWRLRYLI